MTEKANFDGDYGAKYKELAKRIAFGNEDFFLMILSYLSEMLKTEANILDVGCGPGEGLSVFAKHRPRWKLTGVDPAEQMIKMAIKKIDENELHDRVRLYHGYIDSIPTEEKFDAVTSLLVLHFLPDDGSKLSLLKKIHSLLREGGTFIMTCLTSWQSAAHTEELLPAWKNYMLDRGVAEEEMIKLIDMAKVSNHFVSQKRIEELLMEAGFDQINLFFKVHMHGGWVARKTIIDSQE